MQLFFLSVGFFVILTLVNGIDLNNVRQKRSALDLAQMISLTTNLNPKTLLVYGNWCGPGGQGHAFDEIDDCCRMHDFCYEKFEKLNICQARSSFSVYLVKYIWTFNGSNIYCGIINNECQNAVCECDRKLAICLLHHDHLFNKKNILRRDFRAS